MDENDVDDFPWTDAYNSAGYDPYQRRAGTEEAAWRMHSEVCRMVHSGWRHNSRRERRC